MLECGARAAERGADVLATLANCVHVSDPTRALPRCRRLGGTPWWFIALAPRSTARSPVRRGGRCRAETYCCAAVRTKPLGHSRWRQRSRWSRAAKLEVLACGGAAGRVYALLVTAPEAVT